MSKTCIFENFWNKLTEETFYREPKVIMKFGTKVKNEMGRIGKIIDFNTHKQPTNMTYRASYDCYKVRWDDSSTDEFDWIKWNELKPF